MKTGTLIAISSAIFMSAILTSCVKHCECPQPPTGKTLTLQPGSEEGQDCLVAFRNGDKGFSADANHSSNPDINASTWTYGAQGWGTGTNRTFLKFTGLSSITANAVIKSAKLSLYGLTTGVAAPQGNSVYPGSPYASYGSNKAWLKRVLADWDESTITWNNKPATTDDGQVEIAESTAQWNYNVIDLDVTALVQAMVAEDKNYGFCLQLQIEEYYRNIAFSSSESTDPSLRPKLVVEYTTN